MAYEIWPDENVMPGTKLSRAWPLEQYPVDIDIETLRDVAATHWQSIKDRFGFELSEPTEDCPVWRHLPNVGNGTHWRSTVVFLGRVEE